MELVKTIFSKIFNALIFVLCFVFVILFCNYERKHYIKKAELDMDDVLKKAKRK